MPNVELTIQCLEPDWSEQQWNEYIERLSEQEPLLKSPEWFRHAKKMEIVLPRKRALELKAKFEQRSELLVRVGQPSLVDVLNEFCREWNWREPEDGPRDQRPDVRWKVFKEEDVGLTLLCSDRSEQAVLVWVEKRQQWFVAEWDERFLDPKQTTNWSITTKWKSEKNAQ